MWVEVSVNIAFSITFSSHTLIQNGLFTCYYNFPYSTEPRAQFNVNVIYYASLRFEANLPVPTTYICTHNYGF